MFGLDAAGEGHNEEPLADMGRSHVGSAESRPDRIIPERGKITEDAVESVNNEIWHVLQDRESGSKLAKHSSELAPKTRASTADTSDSGVDPADATCVLTGESPADKVDFLEASEPGVSDIFDAPICSGPVLRQHGPAKWVLLHLPRQLNANAGFAQRQLDAELEPANPGKERSNTYDPHAALLSARFAANVFFASSTAATPFGVSA